MLKLLNFKITALACAKARKNPRRNSVYIFRQQRNLLHFLHMPHNFCFIFHNLFHNFILFLLK